MFASRQRPHVRQSDQHRPSRANKQNPSRKANNSSLEVEFLNKNPDRKSHRKRREEMEPSQSDKKTSFCSRCGSSHAPKQCPAFGQTCHKYHGNNHFTKMCRFKTPTTAYSKPRIHEVHKEESTDEFSSDEARRTVHRKNYENNSQERINYEPQGQRQKCKIQN